MLLWLPIVKAFFLSSTCTLLLLSFTGSRHNFYDELMADNTYSMSLPVVSFYFLSSTTAFLLSFFTGSRHIFSSELMHMVLYDSRHLFHGTLSSAGLIFLPLVHLCSHSLLHRVKAQLFLCISFFHLKRNVS